MADAEFILLGDALWLDFVNTGRGRGPVTDRLPDAAAYHRWAKASRIASDADVTGFHIVRRFRSRLTALAESLDAGMPPPTAVITALNELLARAPGHERLRREGGAWRLRFEADTVPGGLVAVAHSAATMLADPAFEVHRCAAESCTLFFAVPAGALDRHWCSLEPCGRESRVERRRGVLRS
ncbi:MAG TPA: ABATE domain-containing protein [Gemmatimonadales bacterium]|nr:ABATE domain-containing protein [Gemmatimonadales bacterium]